MWITLIISLQHNVLLRILGSGHQCGCRVILTGPLIHPLDCSKSICKRDCGSLSADFRLGQLSHKVKNKELFYISCTCWISIMIKEKEVELLELQGIYSTLTLYNDVIWNGWVSYCNKLRTQLCYAVPTSQSDAQLKSSFHWVFTGGCKFNLAFLCGAGVRD